MFVCKNIDTGKESSSVIVLNQTYPRDHYTNVSPAILTKLDRKLHLDPRHPLGILKDIIYERFPDYARHETFAPVVTPYDNFDSLLIPANHPGRSKHDNYYINEQTMLRSHSSAHQLQVLQKYKHKQFLVAADVYRRDEIDTSHYPVFHQMEGVRLMTPQEIADGTIARDIERMRTITAQSNIVATDDTILYAGNAIQPGHSPEQVNMVMAHLKASLNYWVAGIFGRIGQPQQQAIPVRWIEGSFPFTSPSWELEVLYQGQWLEICGCGVMQQRILDQGGMSDHLGWAVGFGLERLAMVLFDIPDIRLFWSQDARFLGQFTPGHITRFQPFSKFPPCLKDISFWLPTAPENSAAGSTIPFHANDLMDLVREVAQDLVEDVKLIDQFVHPKSGRSSQCYRIVYRSMDRSVTNDEINAIQQRVREQAVQRLGLELR
ncbi:phenylalanyl-tRNA synthetase alpha subunit, mitochondrial [Dimargaris xerosporica]|nr:phenylalanyl-tRNA synthetase alpha subunit, mitochondrial [Dimargaris xerosporica]